MNPTIITTNDGSHTLRVVEINETYHSIHGALQEAKHVFLKQGFHYKAGDVSVLEIGFGTGLNTCLTMLEAHKTGRKVKYVGIEKYPLSKELIHSLNYGTLLGESEWFDEIHEIEWGKEVVLSDFFMLTKLQKDAIDIDFESCFDLVFFDAFAPEKQPELWTKAIFLKLHKALKQGGVLVTYCAKGQVKRDLKEVGFVVESVVGPPGKREMIRVQKAQ